VAYARQDFKDAVAKRDSARVSREQSSLKQMALAEPAMGLLVGDEKWDFFLRVVQFRIEQLQAEVDAQREFLADGPTA
jgi:hypothetical protein